MKPSPYAFAIVGLCGAIAMAEGLDAQVMAFAAPLVAREWKLDPSAIGALLAASIIAMVLAGFMLAPLGDRLGRRPAILFALAVAATATAAGAIAPGFAWLLCSRVVAGLGLGLAFPTVVALAMEVMPRRYHALAVVTVSCGYPVGGAVGGAIAAQLINDHGAPSIFLLGGATTALFLGICLLFLPESPLWLAGHRPGKAGIARLVRKLGAMVPAEASSFGMREGSSARSPVAALFTAERRARTLLLWAINFCNLSMVYFYIIWLPTIVVNGGQDASFAAQVLALFSAAGVAGGLLLALLLRRKGAGMALGTAYLGSIFCIALLGNTSGSAAAFLPVVIGAGSFVVGSQFCLNAVVNQYYPSAIRATAAGFAGGAGRLGAVAAPLIGALLVHPATPYRTTILAGGVPAVLALIALIVLLAAAPLQQARSPTD
ncbi:MFS transporter [Sphingobium sp. AP50]|uniref:MFS transporter n=1 Tax=Sphingobium sp. AP50 TaxID=1884369 RepID=UPI0015A5AA5B|nr:MFS transporter [Sphingobium sp. AP50]